MTKRTGNSAISHSLDELSASEEDDDLLSSNGLSAQSAAENTKRDQANVKSQAHPQKSQTKPLKTRTTPQTTGPLTEPTKTKRTRAKRGMLKEVPDTQIAEGASDVDDLDLAPDPSSRAMSTPMTATKTTVRPPKRPASDTKPRGLRGRPKKQMEEIAETQQDVQASSNFGRSTTTKKPPKPVVRETVPETQAEPMELDSEPVTEQTTTKGTKAEAKTAPKSRAGSQQRQASHSRRDGGSASGNEKMADPVVRRKLGDVTNKVDAMSVRCDQFRDTCAEAESNFDKLKVQADARLRAAEALIESLQHDLKAQTAIASEAALLRTELSTLRDSHTNVTASNKSLKTSLATAQNEVKTLEAKLAAPPSTSEQAASRPNAAPSSAAKGPKSARNGATLAGDAERRVLKLKEDLYADLTGLIIRDVKRREAEGEEVYDCIQTGRNGTLRFQLTIPTNLDGTSYDDAEFAYEPVFDAAGNDRGLIALLPDYLTEEICFPRRQACKFYARIVDILSRKREEDGVVEGVDEEQVTEEMGDDGTA